jgi:hypothetical protein
MDLSAVTDRLGGLRDKLPGGGDDGDDADGEDDSAIPSPSVPDAAPDLPDAAPDVDLPDPQLTDDDGDSRVSLGLTILTLLGLAIAAVAAVARFALDKVGSDDPGEQKSTPDPSEDEPDLEFGHDASAAGVPTETELATETDLAAEADETDATPDDHEADGAEARTDDADAEPDEDGRDVDTGPSATEQILGTDEERDDGPRIAPLVGMAAQVGFRLFVEKLRERSAADTDDTRS